jgi:hypothetical protein
MNLLTELRDLVTLTEKVEPNRWLGQKLLREDVAAQGLRITECFSLGRALFICVCWVPPQDADQGGSPLAVSLGLLEFLARRNGEFSQPKWRPLRPDRDVGFLLRKELGDVMKVPPIALFSERGLDVAKRQFEWQPLHRMTPKELKVARVDFVRKNSVLWSDHKTLALALLEAELYHGETDLRYIQRSIPKLLDEVQNPESET